MFELEQMETALTFGDVLLLPGHSDVLPSQADVEATLAPGLTLRIPLLSAAMDTVTGAATAICLARQGGIGIIHRNLSPDEQAREVAEVKAADPAGGLLVGAAVGVGPDRGRRVPALLEAGCDLLVVDTAHGHSQMVLDAVAEIRRRYPEVTLAAGNVATAAGCRALAKAGANIVKVGVGPGSICTTRVVTGVGVPQLSAIAECARAAESLGVTIVADGGLRYSGDVAKAIAAGAHAVMVGSLFAGTDEAPGEKVLLQGQAYKVYRGMGSLGAMQEGSSDRYFQGDVTSASKLVPEGVEGRVPYRGALADIVFQLIGGLRSAMGYVGAANLTEMRKRSRFVRVTASGERESHVHDVVMVQEAPNYRAG